jgi:hypothetical protein
MVRRRFDAEDQGVIASVGLRGMNTGLLESFLYFDDSRDLSFSQCLVSFNALQGRQP